VQKSHNQRMQGAKVTSPSFQTMTIDELWALREEIGKLLEAQLMRERQRLEQRLAQLGTNGHTKHNGSNAARRPYPKVIPKYQNPAKPTETWSGRGKQPKWVSAQLKSGKTLDDFAITRRRAAA
jgi:DNA-binding protein H-NS